ncbi:DUF418 domain-containing protein [Fervidibacillus halotolerans]|uniref:DUF418 domain-containing protein n=1 Tax=Fervidibacillus halotolerans TaxID=2980027 RepID=A0A9E8M2H4_9BACI|nr:DUF418 domain-containing protein [Fervidibacillus halotolerans]WAA13865.1 DUF418 domain-containing protein [Fervidibacillus halotolerans]
MYFFSMPYVYVDPFSEADSVLDRTIYLLTDVFAQASFYPLFSFLFGYSFILLMEKLEERQLNTGKILFRRMVVLFIIGFIHIILFWSGDILVTYATIGFLLLFVKKWGERKLTITAILLYSIPQLFLSLLLLIFIHFVQLTELNSQIEKMGAQATKIYQNGNFLEVARFRIEEWWYFSGVLNFNVIIILFLTIFPLFLIGMAFAKGRRLEKSEANRKFFKRLFLFTFPTGLLLKFVPYFTSKNEATEYIQDFIGGPLLAFAYISLFYILVNGGEKRKIWRYFADVGKMSLTNYLLQSLISTFLFYGYGLGLYGKLAYYETTFIVLIIYLFQILFSRYWFQFYRQGPVEWIWRGFTFGRFSPLKKGAPK